ncbi:MAG TPA: fibronectin type III domain-containing protein, partial [Jatrophihabitantaceae bacterium]|nr:fibronectin type III domain-containing protein [Jatrophihabitantaceae bacterium]
VDSDFAGVTICRATGTTPPTSNCIPIATLDAPTATYTDTGRAPGTPYSYSVFSYDLANNTSAAATFTATTLSDTTPPAKVTGLTATPLSTTSINLTWTNPVDSDFAGVTICRAIGSTPPTSNCIPIATLNAPTATYTDTGRAPGTQYAYSVFAFDTANNTSAATTVTATTLADTTPPAKVTSLTATPLSATSIQLNWTNPADADFAGVSICRANGSVPPTSGCAPIAIVNSPTATYTDSGRSPSTLYSYALFAFDMASNNSAATTVSATTLADTTPPAKVSSLTATPLSDTAIQLGWTNPADADFAGVKICRAAGSTPPVAGCVPITTVNAPTATYTDNGRTASTQYAYSVFAFDTANNTAAATTAVATTLAAAITGISGTVTDASGPVAGVNVQVYDASGAPVAAAVTAANGGYTVTALTAGTYHVCFFADSAVGSSPTGYLSECYDNLPPDSSVVATTAVTVVSGSVHSNVNAALAKAVGFSGIVTGTDGPIQRAQAELYNSSGDFVTSVVMTPAANGSYTITGLTISPGSYFVCWDGFGTQGNSATDYQPQCYNGKSWDGASSPNILTATQISLSAGTLKTNVNATLGVGGAVLGQVTDGTDGFGVADLTVYAFTTGGVVVSVANTDSDGDYLLPGLASGKVWVCFDTSFAPGSAPHGYVSECYNNHPWNPLTTPTNSGTDDVTITGGSSTTLDVSLTRNP